MNGCFSAFSSLLVNIRQLLTGEKNNSPAHCGSLQQLLRFSSILVNAMFDVLNQSLYLKFDHFDHESFLVCVRY